MGDFINEMSSEYYYWRIYTGIIPQDAVIGGQLFGKPTYLGQVAVEGEPGIHTAIIFPENLSVLSCLNGKSYWEHNYVMILCSNRQENLRWVKSSTSSFVADNAVVGGFLRNHFVFIGRTLCQNDLISGKIVPSGMYFPTIDGPELRVDDFEVLVYT